MEHISNVILVILSFLCPRKLAIAIFRKTKFINKIIDVYAQKESFFYVKKYKKYESQGFDKTILVYRNKGKMLDAGTINDYVNLVATGIINKFKVIFVSKKREDGDYSNDLYNRYFEQDEYKDNMEILSYDEVMKKYKCVSFGSYLSINKRKTFAYNRYLSYKQDVLDYFKSEEDTLFNTKPILGVFMRGTDYINLKPKNHPRVPSLNEVFKIVDKELKNYAMIYLATEDKNIVDSFKKKYGNDRILTNKTIYLNVEGDNKNKWISNVELGIKDEYYYRGLTYISSMNLLAKCDALVACVAGGSAYAKTINNNSYKKCILIKKGFNR